MSLIRHWSALRRSYPPRVWVRDPMRDFVSIWRSNDGLAIMRDHMGWMLDLDEDELPCHCDSMLDCFDVASVIPVLRYP